MGPVAQTALYGATCAELSPIYSLSDVEVAAFVSVGFHNPNGNDCSGGADCVGKLEWRNGNGLLNDVLPFDIDIQSALGLCVAYSRADHKLVSVNCSDTSMPVCQKNCSYPGESKCQ